MRNLLCRALLCLGIVSRIVAASPAASPAASRVSIAATSGAHAPLSTLHTRFPMSEGFRNITTAVEAREQSEGQGARVRRSIGNRSLPDVDPFLMLDEFHVDPPAGFPSHPHRGFETVTYMLTGSFTHRDNKGHAGTINAGDLQWMTAGRGVVHSEMPGPEGGTGLQLWVNLPAAKKMTAPRYQELLSKDVKEATGDGVRVRVIAGKSMGVESQVYTHTPIMYLDFHVEAGKEFVQDVPEGWNGFVYVIEGQGYFGSNEHVGSRGWTLVLGEGEKLRFFTKADSGMRFVLLAGTPHNEPIAKYGPMVMNTNEELQQAFADYRAGKF